MSAGIRNKSKTIRAAALFFGLLAAGGIVAAVSMSTNYKISNAVVTSGGGRSQSASYVQPDSAVGPSGTTAYSTSASYRNLSGAVGLPFGSLTIPVEVSGYLVD